jgi:hypothetical protein
MAYHRKIPLVPPQCQSWHVNRVTFAFYGVYCAVPLFSQLYVVTHPGKIFHTPVELQITYGHAVSLII